MLVVFHRNDDCVSLLSVWSMPALGRDSGIFRYGTAPWGADRQPPDFTAEDIWSARGGREQIKSKIKKQLKKQIVCSSLSIEHPRIILKL